MDLATLGLRIDSSDVPRAANDLDKLSTAARKTETATGKMAREIDHAEKSVGGMSRALRVMAPIMAAVTAALSVRGLQQYADAWSDMQSRVGAAVKDMSAAPALMQRMVQLANSSYSPLQQTVEVYTRNVGVLRELGLSAASAADFTESLNHMLVITATRGERAASVQDALSKAMAVGRLQADGLETVMANSTRVGEALAAELGTTTSSLRSMASEGKITAEVIANALLNSLEDVRGEAAEMPATIGDAFTRINNNVLQFVGTLDKTYGISSKVADAMLNMADGITAAIGPSIGLIDSLAENFERGLAYAMTFGAYMGGAWVVAWVKAGGAVAALTAGLGFLRASLIRTGIGALIVIAGELAYQMYNITEGSNSVSEAFNRLGSSAVQTWQRIQDGAAAVDAYLYGVALNVRAYFLQAWADILQSFSNMMNGIMGANNALSMTIMSGPWQDALKEAKAVGVDAGESIAKAGELWQKAWSGDPGVTRDLGTFPATMDDIATASGGAVAPVKALGGALGGAGSAAAKANNDLEQFISKADQLAEKLFPGEYARREAEELSASLAQYGKSLDEFQRQGVESRIADMFKAAGMNVRDLEDTTADAGKNMADSLQQTLGSVLNDLFSSPIEDFDAFLDRVLTGFAQIGQQNLSSLFGGSNAAGSGAPDPMAALSGAVQKGAEKGTKAGAAGGIFDGLGSLFGEGNGQGGNVMGGMLSAGVGGLGIGYQAQDPLMGAVGGAMQGFAAGAAMGGAMGPIGAVVGGLAGFIGGMMGANKALKEAKEALAKVRGEIDNLIDVGEGRGLGDATKAFRDFADQSLEYQTAAAKAKDRELQKQLQNAVNSFFDALNADFNLGFAGTIEALSSGQGLSGAFVSAQGEIVGLREELKGFIADTEFLGNKLGELASIDNADDVARNVEKARRAAQDYALSVLAGADEMTEFEDAMLEANGRASALQVTLEQLGMASEQAAEAIAGALNVALAKLRDEYVADLNASINDLSDFGFLNDMVQAQAKYQERLRDSAALGLDGSLALRELNLSLADIVRSAELTQGEIDLLAAAFPLLSGLIETVAGQDAMATVADARAELQRAYDAEAAALNDVIGRTQRFIASIKQFRDAMRLDATSPLGQEAQLLEAQRQYRETLALANGGDENAMAQLTDVSQAYLDEAREYYASSEAYAEIWREVDRTLAAMEDKAGNQLTEAQRQLDALNQQVGHLISIDQSVRSVEQALQGMTAAMAARDAALQAQLAAMTAQSQSIGAAYQTYLGRDADAGGAAFYQGQVNAGKSVDAVVGEIQNSPEAKIKRLYQEVFNRQADAAGLRFYMDQMAGGKTILDIENQLRHAKMMGAFAMGGYTGDMAANAVAGVVHGQEFVVNAAATRQHRPMLEAINAGRGGNDNGDVVQELRSLRAELAAVKAELGRQTSVIVQSDEASRALQRQGNAELADVADGLKKANAA